MIATSAALGLVLLGLGAQAPANAPAVEAERARIEQMLAEPPSRYRGPDELGAYFQSHWVGFARRKHSAVERQALQAIVDRPARPEHRGLALAALAHDSGEDLWAFWTGFERRPDFTDADLPTVVSGLQHADPDRCAAFLLQQVHKKLNWARVVLEALEKDSNGEREFWQPAGRRPEQKPREDAALWPDVPASRLEELARDPKFGDARPWAWCALLKKAEKERSRNLRDELLAGKDATLRERALWCSPEPPDLEQVEKLAEGGDAVALAATRRSLDAIAPDDGKPHFAQWLRLTGHKNPEMREAGRRQIVDWTHYELDTSQMRGLRQRATEAQVDELLALVERTPAWLADPAVALAAGQQWELRGKVEPALKAFRAAAKDVSGAAQQHGSASHEQAMALIHLSRLEYTLGHEEAGASAAKLLGAAYRLYGLDTVYPTHVYDRGGEEISKALLERYSGWLEYTVAVAPGGKEVVARLKNRGKEPHVLTLQKPEWKTSEAAVPRYFMVWVGAVEVQSLSTKYQSAKTERTLAPGQALELRLPVDLSKQKAPYKLAVSVDLDVDSRKDGWRVEALAFVR